MNILERLTEKSWLSKSPPGASEEKRFTRPSAKVGLWLLLGVVSSLFLIIITAYRMRMGHMGMGGTMTDWRSLPDPPLLWANTVVLILSSLALQWTRGKAHSGQTDQIKLGLIIGGFLALGFLGGQLVAWRELVAAGYFLTGNPANAFFYFITAAHGIHIFGGLVALTRTVIKAWRHAEPTQVRVSVDLCTIYWHYLLLLWFVLFALLLLT